MVRFLRGASITVPLLSIFLTFGVTPATAAPEGGHDAVLGDSRQFGEAGSGAVLTQAGADGKPLVAAQSFTCSMEANSALYEGAPRYFEYYANGRCTMPMAEIGVEATLWSTNNRSGPGNLYRVGNGVNIVGDSGEFDCVGDGKCIGHWIYRYSVDFKAPPGYVFQHASGICRILSGGTLLVCSDSPEGDVTG